MQRRSDAAADGTSCVSCSFLIFRGSLLTSIQNLIHDLNETTGREAFAKASAEERRSGKTKLAGQPVALSW
jgi:hypothetical protein